MLVSLLQAMPLPADSGLFDIFCQIEEEKDELDLEKVNIAEDKL